MVEVKYGRRLQAAFRPPGWQSRCAAGSTLMPNEQYQSLFGLAGDALRQRLLDGAPDRRGRRSSTRRRTTSSPGWSPTSAGTACRRCCDAYAECDEVARPAERRLRLHGQGLGPADRREPAQPLGAAHRPSRSRRCASRRRARRRDRVGPRSTRQSPAGRAVCERAARGAAPAPRSGARRLPVSPDRRPGCGSTKPLVDPGGLRPRARRPRRGATSWSPYLVTTAPDVATSTNLAGFINRMGVFAPTQRRAWSEDPHAALGRGAVAVSTSSSASRR